jgi:two-component system, OmpR family, sensor histidine kinase SenX3
MFRQRRRARLTVGALAAGAGGVAILLASIGGAGVILAVVFVAAAAFGIARFVDNAYVRPLDDIGEAIGDAPGTRTAAELAAELASEYRAVVSRLSEVAIEGRHREAALANTSDAVVIMDPSGLVEYANPTARLFLQARTLEATRRLGQPDIERLVARSTLRGEAIAEDVTLWVPGARPARARAVPIAGGGTVVLLSDLSETYRLDRMRRDFVANVSHELKTPVAAIRALAETAATAFASDDLDTARRFVDRLGTEATRLSGLIADLLDLSRVEAGGELEFSPVTLNVLLADAADRARPVAEVKGIEIRIEDTALVVHADPSQLSMAVKNLVDNAVRYSEGGSVDIGVVRRDDWVEITVADQGIGIPTDEVGRIFERFYRVDKARSRVTGGTGLGLAIVRHVAENHGGRVEVQSELGVGSTFTLIIPADRERVGSAA